ncbi:MAG: hypothetical protein IJ642_01835 [Oscillospiraceae bacterium]|nr:hypothetical protein [Oscillospiraceae bacterium]
MLFYLLSLMTGILECGWICAGVKQGLPLWEVLSFTLAYHAGNLFPKPFSLGKSALLSLSGISAVLSLLMIAGLTGVYSALCSCVCLFCLSAGMQSVRSGLKSNGNRLFKRICRVAGFLLAPLAGLVPELILLLFSLMMIRVIFRHYQGKAEISRMHSQGGYSAVMVLHQLHYFFYAHITLAAIAQNIGILPAMVLFCGTWLTYMSVEPLVSGRMQKLLPVFFAGHLGISVLLLYMSFVRNLPVFLILWLVTGFGGGVVYTISAQAKKVRKFEKDSMTISENLGHTFGLLTAVLISALYQNAPVLMLRFGALSAFLAVLGMLCVNLSKKTNFSGSERRNL